MRNQPTIGLEIHAELNTESKMFCACKNDSAEIHPNVNICPVCMGHPGTLPVANKSAIEKVILMGLALGGKIAEYTRFDRKNYFYPDLPKGYQISQYEHPVVQNGELILPSLHKKIRIKRVHLEEDTGRLLHGEKGESLIDYNRAGVPLMEMVTEADLSSAEEVSEFAEEFRLLLRYLNVSGADMEKGELRLEANVSLDMGTKTELKNINSFNALRRAVDYEIKRQAKALEDQKEIKQETRGWDEAKQKTFSQREKEGSEDYRYFPEPDLPPIQTTEEFDIEKIKARLPELPADKRKRLFEQYGIDTSSAKHFAENPEMAEFFENALSEVVEWDKEHDKEKITKLTLNYLTSDLSGLVNEKGVSWGDLLITPENFAELIKMIADEKVSSRAGKDILRIMAESGGDPSQIAEEKGLTQVSDESALEKIAKKIIEANSKPVEDYKSGKENALQFLVGQVMRETKGSANPEVVRKVLKDFL